MDTFTLDPGRWRIGRLFGRNPLLRRVDRIEALVVLVALVVSLVAIPIAGVLGLAVYGARDRVYARQAHDRHRVIAKVTSAFVEDWGVSVVQARWPLPAGERTGTLTLASRAKAGDSVDIWVDQDGNPVVPPTPGWLAVGEGLGTVALALLAVGLTMAAAVAAVRSRLDRARDAAWERDIQCLADAS